MQNWAKTFGFICQSCAEKLHAVLLVTAIKSDLQQDCSFHDSLEIGKTEKLFITITDVFRVHLSSLLIL